ncbi:MAG: ATP synthase F1 subunit gamma [Bacteroidia bacterium]|nr:ATP synthase F1 subunit gamma [Bacteroidia bacterium]
MPSLKEIRGRIKSVRGTQQITKAMKMVSAAKLRKAQDAIIQLRPYASKLKEILQNLSQGAESGVSSPFLQGKENPQTVLLIVVTSNKGLCSSFNSNVIKSTLTAIQEKYSSHQKNKTLFLWCIGKKGHEYFQKRGYQVVNTEFDLFTKLSFDAIAMIAREIMSNYVAGKWDKVDLFYNEFKNIATQIRKHEQYLPTSSVTSVSTNQPTKQSVEYIYEPNKAQILAELIPRSLTIQLFKAILESNAAEHGARMTAMDKATENAQELLGSLRLTYNRARQAAITKEILEIVGGAEALKG